MKKTGMLVRAILLTAVLLLLPAQAVLADDAARFVPGTKVNGIGIGGLTVEEAKAQIEGFYSAEYMLTIKEKDDAYISAYKEGQPFTIIPEIQGNNADKDKVLALVREAAESGAREVDIAAAGAYVTVKVTAEDTSLKDLCQSMNRCRDMVITYRFGEEAVELKGDTICTWILGSTPDGLVDVSYDMAAAYVKALADQFDTAGRTRTFRTTDGRDLDLTGPYGWQMDQISETAALIAMIRTGQSQLREPIYSKKAQDRASDWGNTYVEIDLTNQHVYMYKDGNLAWEAPCVTGNVSKNYTTPEGIYSLIYKETDRILRGKKAADGKFEYESHVDYWMPFNGGIGLHDAGWRSKFGGTIYQNNGSHGCINLPSAKAQGLYDLVYTGIPVICYN